MINRYIEYFKDNPEGYWFKRKIYGWGWTPVRWQGWLATGLVVAFILWSGRALSSVADPTSSMITWFLVKLALAVILLLVICYKKGEKPRWQWGLPNNKPEDKKE